MENIEDYIASGILEQYVLEELSPAEARRVQTMAERYPEVRQELALIEKTFAGVAEELAKAPPPQVWDRIQAVVSEENPAEQAPSPPPPPKQLAQKTKKIHYWQYGVAATFTLKLAFMAVAANFWMKWQNTEGKLESLQNRYDQLTQDSRQLTQTLMTVSDPAVQTLVLQNPSATDHPRVLAYWNPATQELLINTASLLPTVADQRYQVWGKEADELIPLGTFEVASDALPTIVSFSGPAALSQVLISQESEKSTTPSENQWSGQVTE